MPALGTNKRGSVVSVQVIMKDGRPEWAVLPYAEYEALLAKVDLVKPDLVKPELAKPELAKTELGKAELAKARSGETESAASGQETAQAAPRLKEEDRRQLRNSMMEQLKDVASISDAGSFQGAKVTAVMQSKGLDTNHVARDVGISPVYLKQIEAGEREPSEPILRNIARALGVDVNELSGN